MARVQRSLRSARGQFKPGDEFRRRMQKQLAIPSRRRWQVRFLPVALAAALLILAFFGWNWYAHRSDAFSEVADLHVNALASSTPVDVVSTDRHTVKPWFQGRIPFSFNIPELTGSAYSLLGGRLVYFHQRPGAQLIVAMRQHKISVMIFQESPETARAFPASTGVLHRDSFSMETWQSLDLRFVLVSDADPAAVDQLAQLLKAANR